MKLLKNPAVALLLCLALILGSTCLNAKAKMEKRYERVCGKLCEEVLEFAEKNDLDELQAKARLTRVNGDYRALIAGFNEALSANGGYKHADDVDDAILAYTKFLKSTERFPASFFVQNLHIHF